MPALVHFPEFECFRHFSYSLLSPITMQPPSLLLLPDRSIGDLHRTALSDQDLMEALIEDTADEFKQTFQHPSGKYMPVCRWNGVLCTRRQVTRFHFASFHMRESPATIDFAFLPPNLTHFDLPKKGGLYGPVETRGLPKRLELFVIPENHFFGSFDFRHLPENTQAVDISRNNFSGSCNLTHLPSRLTVLMAHENDFTGSVSLDNLPECMRLLELGVNKLRGSINLKKLPRDLETLSLRENAFFGEICLDYLPMSVKQIHLAGNRLCGSIRAPNLPESLTIFDLLKNEFTGIAVVKKDFADIVSFDPTHMLAVVDENGRAYKHFRRPSAEGKLHQDYFPLMSLVSALTDASKQMFHTRSGKPLPIDKWPGLEFDRNSRVVGIYFTGDYGFENLEGSLCFDHIPVFVKDIKFCASEEITGTIDTAKLPRGLEVLIVCLHSLDGDFKFERLPMILHYLDISENYFSGTVALDALPINMKTLRAFYNKFHGSLDLTNLPRTLDTLLLSDCRFTGGVMLNLLPPSLTTLSLGDNMLQGSIRLTRISPRMHDIDLDGNNFSGTAVLSREAINVLELNFLKSFDAVVDADGIPFPKLLHTRNCRYGAPPQWSSSPNQCALGSRSDLS